MHLLIKEEHFKALIKNKQM